MGRTGEIRSGSRLDSYPKPGKLAVKGLESHMRYALYCLTVFTIVFGAISVFYGAGRQSYRKRFGK